MQALVLSREPHQEYDERILFLIEKDEVIEAIARGSKKSVSKNSFHLEPGTLVDVEIVGGKEWRYVGSVVPLGDAVFVSTRFETMQALMHLTTLLSDVLEGRVQYHGLYGNVIVWRKTLQGEEGSVLRQISVLLVLVLRSLGYEPVVDRCVQCAKEVEPPYLFSYQHGGMVCVGCRDGRVAVVGQVVTLTPPEFEFLQNACRVSVKKVIASASEEEKVHSLLHAFLEFHLERHVPKFVLVSV